MGRRSAGGGCLAPSASAVTREKPVTPHENGVRPTRLRGRESLTPAPHGEGRGEDGARVPAPKAGRRRPRWERAGRLLTRPMAPRWGTRPSPLRRPPSAWSARPRKPVCGRAQRPRSQPPEPGSARAVLPGSGHCGASVYEETARPAEETNRGSPTTRENSHACSAATKDARGQELRTVWFHVCDLPEKGEGQRPGARVCRRGALAPEGPGCCCGGGSVAGQPPHLCASTPAHCLQPQQSHSLAPAGRAGKARRPTEPRKRPRDRTRPGEGRGRAARKHRTR